MLNSAILPMQRACREGLWSALIYLGAFSRGV